MKKKPRMTYRVWSELWSSACLQSNEYMCMSRSEVTAKQLADNKRAKKFLKDIAKPEWVDRLNKELHEKVNEPWR
tara:strand:+ start:58 stop:282 length:225 start_codon:yes stop_codon:yes gene_type:complete